METINGCTVVLPSEVTTEAPASLGPGETEAAYVALVGVFPPGYPGPPMHTHPNTDEAFYIAEGSATFRLGEDQLEVGAGGMVYVPRGTVHTAWNAGDVPVRGLLIISPGDAEHELVPVDEA